MTGEGVELERNISHTCSTTEPVQLV